MINEHYINRNRFTNIELFRIVTMIMIVAHHYAANSGLLEIGGVINSNPFAIKSYFILILGMWGKIGINCFVFITGYYMCESNVSLRKFLKLLLQIEFYNILINIVFYICKYNGFSIKDLLFGLIPIASISRGFTSCYIIFFLLIPFINILINNMSRKQHLALASILVLFFSIMDSIPKFQVQFNYVEWFVAIYIVASYIRKYPGQWQNNRKFISVSLSALLVISILSVIAMNYISYTYLHSNGFYFFVSDSNQFLALLVSCFAFLWFKGLKIKNSNIINTIAASTFGVLLMHANSDAMRHWLWVDVLDNVGAYQGNIYLHAILSVLGIYIVCTMIDYLRIRFIEKPFFKWYDNKCFKDPFDLINS